MKTTCAAGRTWHFSHAIGRRTSEHNPPTGGFGSPTSLAIAADGVLFVLSKGMGYQPYEDVEGDHHRRICKVRLDELHVGDFARKEFVWPGGIDLSKDGTVYASDEYANVIKWFDPDRTMPFPTYDPDGEALGQWGETGSEPGQLNGPSGLAFDADDNLYVVESRNDRIQKFTKDGRYLTGWGGSGSGEGQFSRPWGITVDQAGHVYVADWGNDRVQKFSADGTFLMGFGTDVEDGGDLDHPADVAVDSEGDVYVTDWGNRRVQIYESGGEIITALYGDATKLSKAGEYVVGRDSDWVRSYDMIKDITILGRFGRPVAVEVDDEDRVIISDNRSRLQVYVKDKAFAPPRLNV